MIIIIVSHLIRQKRWYVRSDGLLPIHVVNLYIISVKTNHTALINEDVKMMNAAIRNKKNMRTVGKPFMKIPIFSYFKYKIIVKIMQYVSAETNYWSRQNAVQISKNSR